MPAIRLIARKSASCLLTLLLLAACAAAMSTQGTVEPEAEAHQYLLYTNDNVFNANSTTALKVSSSGAVKVIQTYSTGGAGAGGGYFALMPIAVTGSMSVKAMFQQLSHWLVPVRRPYS